MPPQLKDAYLKANPDPKGLQAMFDRDRNRMLAFKDFSDSDLRGIAAPVLILDGDADVVRPEHALALLRLVPHGQLAILPGNHGEYLGEICARDKNSKVPALVTTLIEQFLAADTSASQTP
jgi:pimeloyl-ACP methyl ester carboxylesterase